MKGELKVELFVVINCTRRFPFCKTPTTMRIPQNVKGLPWAKWFPALELQLPAVNFTCWPKFVSKLMINLQIIVKISARRQYHLLAS